MADICVPLNLPSAETAEVEIRIAHQKRSLNYRVESFAWAPDAPGDMQQTEARITDLRKAIEDYDPRWELVQIFQPGPRDHYIQVLFRERVQPRNAFC